MGSLPSGTVTFLFTDIEGSTRLARSLGEAWEPLRTRHHKILRTSIESNNGYVFQIIGDAFCASFHNANEALKAAIGSQTDLQKESWGETPIRVRMGLDTGKADVQEDGQYQGYLALNQIQRIMEAGHGGQVLLSGVTENLLRGSLPEGVDLLDLGRHNFKKVHQAVRIFQVDAPDLEHDFPPLRTFNILPNNLPAQLTSFIGREKELVDVLRLLSDTYMLSLIGPGGTGKTRLAIQAANVVLDQYPDGVWLVDLAPILDPLLVPRTTAIRIGLRSESKRPVIDMLCDYLSKKKMLIILDNCEHLVEACAQVADRILLAASEVKILASSREALGIAGEVTYRVPSLGLPDIDNLPALETLDQYEAVKLFIDRATAAIPDFKVTNENRPALARICHRLDGIPLAIELAAGKIRVLGMEQIDKRLDDRFKLLTGGSRTAMERHQTLRAAVDWSYNLLSPEEQSLLGRLAVFRGGWTLEAAETVCGDEAGSGVLGSDDILDILEQLINKSLVITEDEHGTSSYRMLETILQYANEKLIDSGKSETLRERHLEFFLNLAETAEPHLYRHEQLEWLAQLDADYENLRAALELALDKDSAEPSLRLCAALGMYWEIRGYEIEGSKWLAKSLAKPENNLNQNETLARVQALHQDAKLANSIDDIERIGESAKLSLAQAKKLGNKRDITIARYLMALHLYRNQRYEDAQPLLEQSYNVFRELGDPFWEANSYYLLETNLYIMGKRKSKETSFVKRIELARKAGERSFLAFMLSFHARILFDFNKLEESLISAQEADMLNKQVGAPFNLAFEVFAVHAWLKGDHARAESLFTELHDQLDLIGEINRKSRMLASLGRLALEQGHLEKAREHNDEIINTWGENIPPSKHAKCLSLTSHIHFLYGDIKKYKQTLRECTLILRSTQNRWDYKDFLLETLDPFHLFEPEGTVSILGAIHTSEKNPFIEPANPIFWRYYERAEAHLHEVLGDEAFESAFAEGLKMSLVDALDLVLKSLEEK